MTARLPEPNPGPRDGWLGWGGVIALAVLAAGALALATLGCAGTRSPDYLEVHGGYGWGSWDGDGHLSGNPGNGQDATYDADGRSQAVGLTVGWWLTRPGWSPDVAGRLDALQDAFLARPDPPAPVVEVPAVSVDPALQAALEGLTVAVRRLEEGMAAQPAAAPEAAAEAPLPPVWDRTWFQGLMAAVTLAVGALAQKVGLPAKAVSAARRAVSGGPR